MLFRIYVATVVCIGLGFGAEDPKPACNELTAGKLWPDAANQDAKLRKRLARCGELELCTRGVWRYRWEALTVRLDQLRGGESIVKPVGCEILREPDSTGSGQSNSPSR